MKKFYPFNIIQTICLIIISVIATVPVFILENQFKYSFIKRIEEILVYFIVLMFFILSSIYISKKRGLKYIFNYKLPKNSLIIILISLVLNIGIGYPVWKFASIHINTFATNNPFNDFGYVLNNLLFAPILEEIMFSVIILHNFLKRYGVKKALIYTTLLFAIIHAQPALMIYALFHSFSFYIYYRFKSLTLVVIIHFVENLSSSVITYLFYNYQIPKETIYGDYTFLIISISTIILSFLVYYFLKKCQPIQSKYSQIKMQDN